MSIASKFRLLVGIKLAVNYNEKYRFSCVADWAYTSNELMVRNDDSRTKELKRKTERK